jgi:DNA-binding NtrC family response regulator
MSRTPAIIAVEDVEVRTFIREVLLSNRFPSEECLHERELLQIIGSSEPSFIFLGHPGSIDPFRLAPRVRAIAPTTGITLVTKESSENTAIAALHAGINNYVRFPEEKERLAHSLHRSSYDKRASDGDGRGIKEARATGFKRLVGDSKFARQLQVEIRRAGESDGNVLITGETGTGKELVAELIHENSSRRDRPFECINCPAVPETLFESELFGYERGAFTGAVGAYCGKLSQAESGTVFLDEIGDLSLLAQAKILRVIEGKPYHRLGGRRPIHPDVRFVMATNRDLEAMAAEGRFRTDLLFRVNARRIHLAPLRERKEDIPLLIENITQRFNDRHKRRIGRVPGDVVELLKSYDWPGNVRELFNVMEATFANLVYDEVRLSDLPPGLLSKVTSVTTVGSERERLSEALRLTDWNLSKAARRLSVSRMTVYRQMAKFHISRQIDSKR